METPEQKLERKRIKRVRLFYLMLGIDILLAIFLVVEIIIAIVK